MWLCAAFALLASVEAASDVSAATVGEGEVKYGLVFDAGSSGTRVHVYSWRVGGGGPKDSFDLIKDDLLKIKPGLSAFKDDPSRAGASLLPLLEYARTKISAEAIPTTPVFLMATAGLRMVGEGPKDAILASVCEELSRSGFLFKCEWATLLGGQDEGLYGWVTVNYLLEALYPPPVAPPVGIIDLGGGSVQIVFETASHVASPSEAKTLSFGSRKHDLYVKSHLGFGLDAARASAMAALLDRKGGGSAEKPVKHPCLPHGATATHEGTELVGDGDWTRCLRLMGRLFKQDITTGQPPLADQFYGFSYMYDRTAAIGLLDEKPLQYGSIQTTTDAIAEAGARVCALDGPANTARFSNTQDASKSHNYCGDVAYLVALLHALGFPPSTPLTMTNKIKDVELVWTLGAMLAQSSMLSAARASGSTAPRLVLGVLLLGVIAFAVTRAMGRNRYSQVNGPMMLTGIHVQPQKSF